MPLPNPRTPEDCIATYGSHCKQCQADFTDPVCCSCGTPANDPADTVECEAGIPGCDCAGLFNDTTYPSQEKEKTMTYTYTILFRTYASDNLRLTSREATSREEALAIFTDDHSDFGEDKYRPIPVAIANATPGSSLFRVDRIIEPEYIVSNRELAL